MELKEGLEPASPNAQYFNSSVLSVSIIGVMQSEVPIEINEARTISLLNDVFLPINTRFSSIMVKDRKGEKQWKRVEVKLEEHVNFPIFPTGLLPPSYDEYLEDYISNIAMEHFPQNKPLWEIHMVKYPTSNAAGTIIFKLHHALGDGYSLMGALLSCLQRADNPSLPLTFPSHQSSAPESGRKSVCGRVSQLCSFIFNSVSDFGWSMLKSTLVVDDRTPIRSGAEGVEYQPIMVSNMIFPMDCIKHIKDKLGVTVNDVITGIIFLGNRLYMQEISNKSTKSHSTALVLLNTRTMSGYKSIEEMLKPNSKVPWGNQFAFLHVPMPELKDHKSQNPLDFVLATSKIIKKKKSSLGVYLTGRFLEIVKKLRGPETAARFVHETLRNSSLSISNVIGPMEQVSLDNHPIKGLYFMVLGVPQNLIITMVSYMGNLRISAVMEKGFLDPQRFKSCVENAFKKILKAADDEITI
ncbi:wax ester synthase/diacylglycerol acyltransferase 11-like isoform X1 [Quercus robur]|uniref:wax ester synthase/diacylglycerol acyltransferase 11-like isoform X1 n=1 Tax=Quercus robur TaxID=38942 RepID=UPI0021615FE9|nr:wax ester synthase/diacylglycerol acyltransferase 11-like isoform X1 [Quercus robur]